MPSPPKAIQEALRRCPQEEDTLARRFAVEGRRLAEAQESSLKKDSLTLAKSRKQPPVLPKEMSEFKSLQQENEREKKEVPAQLDKLTAKPSQELLNAIRIIGGELDNVIKNCPKVGAKQILDSTCVEAAEAKSTKKRLAACSEFLSTINSSWKTRVEPLSQSIQSREKRIAQLLTTVRNPQLALQLKRLRAESWQSIEHILKTVDEVTRLAAQFAR